MPNHLVYGTAGLESFGITKVQYYQEELRLIASMAGVLW